jgi:hypothetical protein
MSSSDDDLERRLSDAMAAQAGNVEPSPEADSLAEIERRITKERRTMSSRRNLFIGLGAAAAIVVIVGAVVLLRDDDKQNIAVTSSSSAPTSSTTSSTTTSTSTPTTPTTQLEVPVPHVWPFESSTTTFTTPEDAARSFAVDYLGMTNARLGATKADTRTATVEIFPNARGNARTVVRLAQDQSAGWVVTGADADEIVVDTPKPHDPVTPSITVSGQSTAFEAQLGLELRPLGSKTAVATGTAMGGSNGEIGPFTTTIDPPSVDQPLVLVVFEGDASGEQTFTKATVVLLGA